MGLISDVIKKNSKKKFFSSYFDRVQLCVKVFCKKNNFMAKNPCFPGNHLKHGRVITTCGLKREFPRKGNFPTFINILGVIKTQSSVNAFPIWASDRV